MNEVCIITHCHCLASSWRYSSVSKVYALTPQIPGSKPDDHQVYAIQFKTHFFKDQSYIQSMIGLYKCSIQRTFTIGSN